VSTTTVFEERRHVQERFYRARVRRQAKQTPQQLSLVSSRY
jgi:hypothetical protein